MLIKMTHAEKVEFWQFIIQVFAFCVAVGIGVILGVLSRMYI